MGGGDGVLLVGEDFFVELFAVAKAGELYLYVLGSGEGYHAAGKVHDAHGLTHVEHEDFTAPTHGAGLEDELAGFGDEHEEAYDVGVGNGDGAAVADLLLEQGDDGAVGAEHVAEACGHELRNPLHFAFGYGLVQALAVYLAYTLGAAHYVGGVHGLVGGYHHELLSAVLDGKVGDDAGAGYVVAHCFDGVVFHHGHVLVGSGVEHVVGPVRGEELFHVFTVCDCGNHGEARYVGELAAHEQLHVVHGRLGLVYEYHLGGVIDGCLLDHFAAYAAGGAGDEYLLAVELAAYLFHIHLYLLAGQEVFDFHVAQA